MQSQEIFTRRVTRKDIREKGDIKDFIDQVMFRKSDSSTQKKECIQILSSMAETLSYKVPYELFYLIFTPQDGDYTDAPMSPLGWKYSCLVALMDCFAIEKALSLLPDAQQRDFFENQLKSNAYTDSLILLQPSVRVETILQDLGKLQKVDASAQDLSEIALLKWLRAELNTHTLSVEEVKYIQDFTQELKQVGLNNNLIPILKNLVRIFYTPGWGNSINSLKSINSNFRDILTMDQKEFEHTYLDFLKSSYGRYKNLILATYNQTPEYYFQKCYSILRHINYNRFNDEQIKFECNDIFTNELDIRKVADIDGLSDLSKVRGINETGRERIVKSLTNSYLTRIMQHYGIVQLPLSDTEFLQIPNNLPQNWSHNLSDHQIFRLLSDLNKNFAIHVEGNFQALVEKFLDEILCIAFEGKKKPSTINEALALLGMNNNTPIEEVDKKWAEIESAFLSLSKPTRKDIYNFELNYYAMRFLRQSKFFETDTPNELMTLKTMATNQLASAKLDKRVDHFTQKNKYHAKKLFALSASDLGTTNQYMQKINAEFFSKLSEIKINPSLFDQVKQELATKLTQYKELAGKDVEKLHRYFASEVIALVDDKRFKSIDLRAVILGICGFFLTLFSLGLAHLHPGFRATFFSSQERYQMYKLGRKLDDVVRPVALAV